MKNLITCIAVLTIGAQASLASADDWVVDSNDDWSKAKARTSHIALKDGFAVPLESEGQFESKIHKFKTARKAKEIVFKQSPVWDNWTQIDDITPPGLGNAYVFLPVAPGDYYVLATQKSTVQTPKGLTKEERKAFQKKNRPKGPGGYHAWHSTDLNTLNPPLQPPPP
ncbi:MAG: hypothetical protein ACR2NU_16630, partial [Aeoliella sp.]